MFGKPTQFFIASNFTEFFINGRLAQKWVLSTLSACAARSDVDNRPRPGESTYETLR